MRAPNLPSDVNSFVKILGGDEKVTANLFARFGERAIGDQALAFAHACCSPVQQRGVEKSPVGVKLLGELNRFIAQ